MSLSRQQLTLLGIFALFFGPLILVILMRSSWWQYQPSGLKNRGHLVQPAVQLSFDRTQSIEDKWLILYVLDKPCEEGCIENVTALRQIHRATGRHGEHLAVALVSDSQASPELRNRLEEIYPGFVFLVDSERASLSALGEISANLATEKPDFDDTRTYVLDPMLNVILAYQNGADPSDIHKDLKRLLKWSDKEGR
jgi:hypothetical protein